MTSGAPPEHLDRIIELTHCVVVIVVIAMVDQVAVVVVVVVVVVAEGAATIINRHLLKIFPLLTIYCQ